MTYMLLTNEVRKPMNIHISSSRPGQLSHLSLCDGKLANADFVDEDVEHVEKISEMVFLIICQRIRHPLFPRNWAITMVPGEKTCLVISFPAGEFHNRALGVVKSRRFHVVLPEERTDEAEAFRRHRIL